MDSLREIKKARLLEDEAFTYMLSSEEKVTIGVTPSNVVWEFDIGGFENPYEDYKCEVINCGHTGNVLTSLVYLYLVAEGLSDNGNFFRKKLSNRECVLSVLPLTAIGDSYVQSDGSNGTTFKIINLRNKKRIRTYFLKPDFTTTTDTVDINVGGTTRWFITFKMTPIVYN